MLAGGLLVLAPAQPAAAPPPAGWNGSILVGTHHKTGTLLLAKVFRVASRLMGVPRYKANANRTACDRIFASHLPGVCIDEHVDGWTLREWKRGPTPFIHAVRDPLEMCVSAYQYHTQGTEAWLTQPLKDLGGKTLQEHYENISQEEGVRFECKRMVGELLDSALLYNETRQDPNTLTLRYEDVSRDFGDSISRLFAFLGSGDMSSRLAKAARQFDIRQQAPQDVRHVSNADEKAALRSSLLGDAALSALLASLRVLLGHAAGVAPTPESLCAQLGAVCATTNVGFFEWCARGKLRAGPGQTAWLPICGGDQGRGARASRRDQ